MPGETTWRRLDENFCELPDRIGFFSSVVWAANDYSVEYSMIDLSGGPVATAGNLEEDILTGDLQGLSLASSQTYDIASIICWPAPRTAAQNWILYQ